MRHNSIAVPVVSIAVLLSLGACGSTPSRNDGGTDLSALQAQQAQLESREMELDRKAAELAARESSLSKSGSAVPASASSDLLPPNAKAGQCFTRVWEPPQYSTKTEKTLVSDASERVEVIPAKYAKKTQRVVLQEASTKIVPVPATYKTVTEKVLVSPAKESIVKVPAVYETVSQRVIDKPAHTTWKKGTGPIQRIDDTTGEIMCLVEVPATYKTINKRVLKTQATTRSVTTPAKYKTVTKRIVDKPASTKTVDIPAKYGNVQVVEMTQPAQERRIPIPAKYANVQRTELKADGKMAWREIMCDTNTTPVRVTKIQTALKKAGFDPGPIDGSVGAGTMRAVNAFQRSKGLPIDKYLNVETVNALGVNHR